MKKIFLIFIIILCSAMLFLLTRKSEDQPRESLEANIPEEVVKTEKTASITFFGDMMLDRRVYNLTKESGEWSYPFLNIEEIFSLSDANIVNLEGPITTFESEAAKTNGMRFTINPLFVSELKKRFSALSLANNHTLDFGEEGLRQTKRNLSEKNIIFFGDYNNRGDNTSAVLIVNGIKFGLIGYHALTGENINNIFLDIKKLKEITDFVIVVSHWGNEYEPNYSKYQEADAHYFIDAGADAVIGGHPHVIQPIEIYKGKAIFYSLGNFIFDQYFSEEVMKGLVIRLEVKITDEESKMSYEIIATQNNKLSQPVKMNEKETDDLIRAFSALSKITDEEREELELFHRLTF